MSITELVLISMSLAMDCFAVAISVGTCRRMTWKETSIMALFFGLFQGAMPVAGWLIGNSLHSLIASIDHWVAFSILSAIGIKMIWQSFGKDDQKTGLDISKPAILLSLSVATSIDALITGVGFGFIEVNIIIAAVLIGIITFGMTVTGAKLGEKTTFIPACWAERAGGGMLIVIGLKVLTEHLLKG